MQVVELKGESITLGGPVLVNIPRLEITTREKLDRALQQRRWHVVMVLVCSGQRVDDFAGLQCEGCHATGTQHSRRADRAAA